MLQVVNKTVRNNSLTISSGRLLAEKTVVQLAGRVLIGQYREPRSVWKE